MSIVSTSRASLWVGKDHLLCIDTNGYTETYKRFYFRDIQAVILRKTVEWHIMSVILSVIIGGFALFALLAGNAGVARALSLRRDVAVVGCRRIAAHRPSRGVHRRRGAARCPRSGGAAAR